MGKLLRGLIYVAMIFSPALDLTKGTRFAFIARHIDGHLAMLGVISGLGIFLFLGWFVTLVLRCMPAIPGAERRRRIAARRGLPI